MDKTGILGANKGRDKIKLVQMITLSNFTFVLLFK